MKALLLVTSCGLVISSSVFASCPSSLTAEKTTECLMVEGSGVNYQDWSKKFYKVEKPKDMMVSEITGEDVRNLKPAAGKK